MDPLQEQAADRAISRYLAAHPEATTAEQVAADPEFHRLLNEEFNNLSSSGTRGTRCDTAVQTCPLQQPCTLQVTASASRMRGGERISITATGNQGPVNWRVTGCSTINTTTGSTVFLTGSSEISETVSVQAFDGRGCTASVNVIVCNLTITTETFASSPADRTRRRIGVGEEVILTANTPCTWQVSGGNGSLSPATGTHDMVVYSAGDQEGTVTITASHSPCTASVSLTVVAPTHWSMQRIAGTHLQHQHGCADTGWLGEVFISPNDVNFYRVEIRERDSQAVVQGVYVGTIQDHAWHGNYDPPERVSDWHVLTTHDPAKGSSSSDLVDRVTSGYLLAIGYSPDNAPPFHAGSYYYPIVWQWHVLGNTTAHNFPTVQQQCMVLITGLCTVSKGGHSEHSLYSDPDSDDPLFHSH